MDLSAPWRDLVPGVVGDVLVTLGRSPRPLSGREVARLAGRPKSTVAAALRELADAGLVQATASGAARNHELVRDHLLAPAVETMAGATAELYRRIEDAVGQWERQPLSVTIYGSAVMGGATGESDLDVMVIRPDGDDDEDDDEIWTGQLGELGFWIERWTGNRAEILDYTNEAIEALDAGGSEFPMEVAAGHTIVGTRLHTQLMRHRLRS